MKKFWKEYAKSNEIEQLDLMKKLIVYGQVIETLEALQEKELKLHFLATLMRSYFQDQENVILDKWY